MKKTSKRNAKPKLAFGPQAESRTPIVPMIRTQGELGDWLGISRQTVSLLTSHRKWPFGKGPWPQSSVVNIQGWRRDNLRLAPEPEYSRATNPNEEIEGCTVPEQSLIDALCKRYPVHPRFFTRTAFALIRELDRISITDEEDERFGEERDEMTSLPLVSRDEVLRYCETGVLPHMEKLEQQAVRAIDDFLLRSRYEMLDAYDEGVRSVREQSDQYRGMESRDHD